MTIEALISKVQEEKPNSFQTPKLLEFINEIEAEVAEQLRAFAPVYDEGDMERKLLAAAPYDKLYVSYLKSMIDYANEEIESYQNNAVQHVQDFRDFTDWVVRSGVAKQTMAHTRFNGIF